MFRTKEHATTASLVTVGMIRMPLPTAGIPGEIVVHLINGYGQRISVDVFTGKVILVDQIAGVVILTPYDAIAIEYAIAAMKDYAL